MDNPLRNDISYIDHIIDSECDHFPIIINDISGELI